MRRCGRRRRPLPQAGGSCRTCRGCRVWSPGRRRRCAPSESGSAPAATPPCVFAGEPRGARKCCCARQGMCNNGASPCVVPVASHDERRALQRRAARRVGDILGHGVDPPANPLEKGTLPNRLCSPPRFHQASGNMIEQTQRDWPDFGRGSAMWFNFQAGFHTIRRTPPMPAHR